MLRIVSNFCATESEKKANEREGQTDRLRIGEIVRERERERERESVCESGRGTENGGNIEGDRGRVRESPWRFLNSHNN